jgi:hypothetical protein
MRNRYPARATARASAVLIAIAGLAAALPLVPAAPGPPPGLPAGAGRCAAAPAQSRTLVDTAGRPVGPQRAAAAVAQSAVYRLGPGTVTVATPLPGFSAATASPAERAATGLDALPAAVRRLAGAPGMRYDPSGSLCQGDAVAGPLSTTSPDWAGVALYARGHRDAFWQAAATWIVPHFTASCGPFSDHSMWTGVGGFSGSGGLMQDGIDTVIGDGVSSPDAVFAWWEVMVFPGIIEPMVKVPLAVHAGDAVTILTEYLAGPGRVVFWFFNRSTGRYKLYSLTSVYGHLPAFFFDGQSAEVINEDAGAAYREPAGDVTRVSQVDFNAGRPASAFPAAGRLVTMTRARNGGPVIDTPSGLRTVAGPSILHSSQWDDQWRRCH